MSIQAVIWDLGGVLVRTEDRGPRTELAERFGMTYEQMDELVYGCETASQAAVGKIDVSQHWENVCTRLNLPASDTEALKERFWGGDRLDLELVSWIRTLRPRYQTALLSNAWSDLRKELAQKWNILDAFDHVFISAEMGMAKPDPQVYRFVASQMGIEPAAAVFIDDFIENIEAARAAGFNAVHFKNATQAMDEVKQILEGRP